MQLSSTLTSNSSANRQNFRAYTLSHFVVKANLKSTKITRLIVKIVNNEGTPGSQGEEGLKDSQAPQTFRRDDLNKKIADDTLLPPSMREPGANKMGAAPAPPQFLLANFLFSPVGRLKIQNPEQHLPAWFVTAYKNLYETDTPSNFPLSSSAPPNIPSPQSTEDLNIFPASLQELSGNRIQLNKMLGLSNLH